MAKLKSIDNRPLFLQIFSSSDPTPAINMEEVAASDIPIASVYSTLRWRMRPWRMLYAVFDGSARDDWTLNAN